VRKVMTGELSREIFSAVNSWKNKRAQPSDPEAIQSLIQSALVSAAPISFVTYWGCGKRSELNGADRAALERLQDFVRASTLLREAPGKLTLVLTDVHAANNAIPKARQEAYFKALTAVASELGFECTRLGAIWADAGYPADSWIDGLRKTIRTPDFQKTWEGSPLREALISQAAKHFEGDENPEEAARRYFCACSRDSELLAHRYSGSIFLTYNAPQFDALLPKLPKLYLYSSEQGTSSKPWFS
jgi:hypothetical protein